MGMLDLYILPKETPTIGVAGETLRLMGTIPTLRVGLEVFFCHHMANRWVVFFESQLQSPWLECASAGRSISTRWISSAFLHLRISLDTLHIARSDVILTHPINPYLRKTSITILGQSRVNG